MPQQFYLTADPATYNPGLWRGNWDVHSAVALLLDPTKTTADLTKYIIQSEVGLEGAWTADPGVLGYRVGLIQMVSGPLLAQRISGTMQIMAGVQDIEDTLSGYYALHVWVTQGETSDLRATLIDNFVDDLTNPWPGIPKGRQLAASAAITAANIQDDDRIVVEIGFIARNQDANNVAGVIYYGTDYYSNGCPDMEEDP